MRDCEVITEAEVDELAKKVYQQGRVDAAMDKLNKYFEQIKEQT